MNNRNFTKQGFTLVEVLVVLTVTISIAVVVVQSLAGIYRSSSKSAAVSEVKQNGQYVLSAMESMIRNAEPTPVCIAPTGTIAGGVTIVNRGDGIPTSQRTVSFVCMTQNQRLVIASSSGVIPTYAPLTSSNVQVVPGSCAFACPTTAPNLPGRVNIQFSLGSYLPGVTLRPQDTSVELFTSSVSQRSYP